MGGEQSPPERHQMTNKDNARITAALTAAIRSGLTVRQAYDSVLGPGGYERMTGMVFHLPKA